MPALTPYEYLDAAGRVREVSGFDISPDCTGESDMDKEAMASLARRLHRRNALIRAIRLMYDAGERADILPILRTEMGDDIRE